MSNAHAAPSPAPAPAAAPTATNLFEKVLGSEVSVETVEAWVEDALRHNLVGTDFASQVLRKFPYKAVRFFGILIANGLATLVGLIPGLPEGSVNAFKALTRHAALGLTGGVAETIQTQQDWDDHIEKSVGKIKPTDLTRPPGEYEAIRVPHLDYFHKDSCPILTRDRDRFEAENPPRTERKKTGTRKGKKNEEIDVYSDVEINKAYPSHTENLFVLLQKVPSGPCPVCFKGEVPVQKHEDEHHAEKSWLEKYDHEQVEVIDAVRRTISALPEGPDKDHQFDRFKKLKDVEPVLVKAACKPIHGNIVGGKLRHDDVEDFLSLVPADGKEELNTLNTAKKLWKSVAILLGEPHKKDEKPLLELYSLELIDFIRASEGKYKRLWFKKKHAHLKDVLKLHDLSTLDEFARSAWTPSLRKGEFKDEAQFLAWSSAVEVLVKAHEYDAERRNPVLRKAGGIAKRLYKWSGIAFLMACAAFVLGWCFANTFGGAMVAGFAGLIALILTVVLTPISGALSILDWFFKDRNQMDDFVRGVQSTLVIYFASMMVLVWAIYGCHFPPLTSVMFFTVLTGCTIAASFGLKKAFSTETLRGNLKRVSLVYGAIYAVILIGCTFGSGFGALQNMFPDDTDTVVRGAAIVLIAATVVGVFYAAWRVFTHVANREKMGMTALAGLLALAVVIAGVMAVKSVGLLDIASTAMKRMAPDALATNAPMGGGSEDPLGDLVGSLKQGGGAETSNAEQSQPQAEADSAKGKKVAEAESSKEPEASEADSIKAECLKYPPLARAKMRNCKGI